MLVFGGYDDERGSGFKGTNELSLGAWGIIEHFMVVELVWTTKQRFVWALSDPYAESGLYSWKFCRMAEIKASRLGIDPEG